MEMESKRVEGVQLPVPLPEARLPEAPASLIAGAAPRRVEAEAQMAQLKERQAKHPFWNNALFDACRAGSLTRDDFKFIFSQYYLYSRNFTRYLNGLMVTCENDLLRSRLSQNLWEEGGGAEPEKRHAEIFRRFLREGVGQEDLGGIEFLDFTRYFVREYLDFCRYATPAESSAFLSLGTEGIVARMYGILVEGMLQAGIEERHLEFFRLHMACDDEHAETLEDIMLSYVGEAAWYEKSERAMDYALELRRRFFENLFEEIQRQRVRGLLGRIQARKSLTPPECKAEELRFREGDTTEPLYSNVNEKLNIHFTVTRAPFPTEVLDPRFVRVAPGKNNEHHKHAHETVFVFLKGSGEVLVDGRVVPVKAGDLVYIPRWCMHQSRNTGTEEMLFLAVADFGLTGKAYIGDYLKTARLKHGAAQEEAPSAVQALGAALRTTVG